MAVEAVTYISDLDPTLPAVDGGDQRLEAAEHLRNIKIGIKNSFPNINNAVNAADENLAARALSGGFTPGSSWTAIKLDCRRGIDGRVTLAFRLRNTTNSGNLDDIGSFAVGWRPLISLFPIGMWFPGALGSKFNFCMFQILTSGSVLVASHQYPISSPGAQVNSLAEIYLSVAFATR